MLPFERYLNIRWAGGGSLRRDENRLAFRTDITGTAQLWTLDGPLEWPEQLTFFEDRLMFGSYHPERPVIAFGKDEGGDERQRIYLVDDDGGEAEEFSSADAKHLWGGWSRDGTLAAWAHNGRNGRDFDIFVRALDGGDERCVLERDGYNYVSAWLPGDDALVVGRAASNIDNDLWRLDLDSGDLRHLTEHDGEAFYASPAPLPDGSGMYLLSDEGRDFTNLAFYDFEADELEFVEEYDWNREEVTVSDDGRWMVLVSNEAGYSVVDVYDRREETERRVEALEDSIAGGIRFARDSSTFALTVSAADDTTDVWTTDAATGGTTRWTRSSTAGIPRNSLVEPELVHFESFDGLRVPGFYYRRESLESPHPVVVDIHGGPESQYRPSLRAKTQYLVDRGFAVFAPNVRGSSGYGREYLDLDNVRRRMDSVEDIRAAREWLVDEGGADPDRIGLIGGSYGGFMVLSSMVTYPELWAAGVDIVGIANFVTFLENTSDYRRHLRESEYGSLEEDREFLEEISPLNHVDKISAPLFVVHGENDPRVPVEEGRQIVEAVREQGLPVRSLVYEDEGHGLSKRENRIDAYTNIGEFFEEHLLE